MVRGTGQQIAISEFADQRARTVKHVGRKGAEVLDIGAHKQGNHRGGNGREPKGARHRGEGIAGRKWRPREGVRGRRVSRPSRAGGGGAGVGPGEVRGVGKGEDSQRGGQCLQGDGSNGAEFGGVQGRGREGSCGKRRMGEGSEGEGRGNAL